MSTKAQTTITETAAERYARIRAEREQGGGAFDVTCIDRADDGSNFPSIEGCGMTWKARRAKREFWVTSGMLPSSLAAKMLEASSANGNAANVLAQSLDSSQIVQSIDFSNKVVRYTALEPKIVDEVTDPATEVQRADVMLCCYNTLLRWQMTGGDEAAGLATFPRKRK